MMGFAATKITGCNVATAENKSAKMSVSVNAELFIIIN
jgi:hypothetical protein